MPRTHEQELERQLMQALSVTNCVRMELSASMQMLEYLINLVPTGHIRNALTEVNIKAGQLRVDLANIGAALEKEQPRGL